MYAVAIKKLTFQTFIDRTYSSKAVFSLSTEMNIGRSLTLVGANPPIIGMVVYSAL